MSRLSVTMSETLKDAVEAAQQASYDPSNDIDPQSQSETASQLMRLGLDVVTQFRDDPDVIEHADDVPIEGLREAVPDHVLLESRRERIQNENRVEDMGGGLIGRFDRAASQRFDAERQEGRHPPEAIESIAEGYVEEADAYRDLGVYSEERYQEAVQAIRDRVDKYRENYRAADHVPEDLQDDEDEQIQLGRDIMQLRDQIDDVVEMIIDRADGSGYATGGAGFDDDAIIQAISEEFAVGEDAIDLVLEAISPDDVSARARLRDDDPIALRDMIPEQAIEDAGGASAALEGGVEDDAPPDRFDDATETAQIRVEPESLENDDEISVDSEVVGETIDDELINQEAVADD